MNPVCDELTEEPASKPERNIRTRIATFGFALIVLAGAYLFGRFGPHKKPPVPSDSDVRRAVHLESLPKGKKLPEPIKSRLDYLIGAPWACETAKSVEGHQVLVILTNSYQKRFQMSWVIVTDQASSICMAAPGVYLGITNGLYEALDLTGDGRTDAVVQRDAGGWHCETRYYICSFHPKFHLMAAMDAGNARIQQIVDLDNDGVMEIVVGNDCFAYYSGLTYAASPTLPMVLRYENGKYVEATAEYPELVWEDMQEARVEMIDWSGVLRREGEGHLVFDRHECYGAAIRWLGEAVILGREDEAYAEIRKIAPQPVLKWLAETHDEVIEIVKNRREKVNYEVPLFELE